MNLDGDGARKTTEPWKILAVIFHEQYLAAEIKKALRKSLPDLTAASSAFGRIVGASFGNLTGYFLILAVVAFTLFGNRSKVIVEEHEGADHGQVVSHETSHGETQHEHHQHDEDHHGSHEQDGSEQPIHHHNVEVSSALAIAAVTPGELSLFQPLVSLPRQLSDDVCPPSPASEIVKPPQVA